MLLLPKYNEQFAKLLRSRGDGASLTDTYHYAPHKPLLLLALMDLIEAGTIQENFVEPNEELVDRFSRYWRRIMGTRKVTAAMPFFHLRDDGLWHLIPRPGKANKLAKTTSVDSLSKLRSLVAGAQLDDGLFKLLLRADTRTSLRRVLTYFTPHLFSVPRDGDSRHPSRR